MTVVDERLAPDQVKELFRLDAKTGKVYFRERGREWFEADQPCKTWNTRFAGKETFTFFDKRKGEYTGNIFGQGTRRAMIVYCLAHGIWPPHRVGFHDGDKKNTRPENIYLKEPRR